MRYEVGTYNEKDKSYHFQSFDTKKQASERASTLKKDGYKIKGPRPVK